jgi:type II secretory pathway component PulF
MALWDRQWGELVAMVMASRSAELICATAVTLYLLYLYLNPNFATKAMSTEIAAETHVLVSDSFILRSWWIILLLASCRCCCTY